MARLSGNWLATLQFDDRGRTRVVQVLCYNRAQLDDVIATAKALDPLGGPVLAENAVWHSGQRIYLEETLSSTGISLLSYAGFVAEWASKPRADRAVG